MLEYRVWTENGDFLGSVSVHSEENGSAWLEIEPFRYDECPDNPSFPTVDRAARAAESMAERFASEARQECPCNGDDECGVNNSHGVYVEKVGDAFYL